MSGIRLKLTTEPGVVLFWTGDSWVEITRAQAVMLLERHLFGLPLTLGNDDQ